MWPLASKFQYGHLLFYSYHAKMNCPPWGHVFQIPKTLHSVVPPLSRKLSKWWPLHYVLMLSQFSKNRGPFISIHLDMCTHFILQAKKNSPKVAPTFHVLYKEEDLCGWFGMAVAFTLRMWQHICYFPTKNRELTCKWSFPLFH
ncbi:hypothetical protein VIGAN_01135800 [Vigna angularis var. angularis]|uniref:Uncharacterized protein n=1 Tax=Vigna angularis var. angularis TaxID=157739 RepID=A0A0S3QZN4_PHAAN|nr:hypothetical protein VIGAN_01135800 [Vigna angularis var. angularis]